MSRVLHWIDGSSCVRKISEDADVSRNNIFITGVKTTCLINIFSMGRWISNVFEDVSKYCMLMGE